MVRRVVDGPEHRQGLVNLLPVEERLSALHGEAKAGGLEGLLEEAHLGEPPGEDQNVSGPAGSVDAGPRVANGVCPARGLGQEGGESARFGVQEIVASGCGRGRKAEGHDRGLVRQARGRIDGLVGGLVRLVGGLDQLAEHAVDEAQDRGARPEVLLEVQHRPFPGPLPGELSEQPHLGATKAIDGLLGVAHHHQRPGAIAGEEPGDLHLERVGVLKLVDDDVPEATVKMLPHRRAVTERVASLDEQSEKVEDTSFTLVPFIERRHPTESPNEPAMDVGAQRGAPRGRRFL